MKVRDLAIAMIVVQCGGNTGLFFKTQKMAGISSDHSWRYLRLFIIPCLNPLWLRIFNYGYCVKGLIPHRLLSW